VGSAEHKILTPTGYVSVSELQRGSVVSTPSPNNFLPSGIDSESHQSSQYLYDEISQSIPEPNHIDSKEIVYSCNQKFVEGVALVSLSLTEWPSFPPGSNLVLSHEAHASDDLSSSETNKDFQFDCHHEFHSCDEPLRPFQAVSRDDAPLPGDAREHKDSNLHWGDPDNRLKYNHSYQLICRPSNTHAPHRAYKFSSDDVLPPYESSVIKKIEYVCDDYFYDLTVPLYHNYQCLSTMVHSNSGKTTIGACEHVHYALGSHPFKKIRTPNISVVTTAKSKKEGLEAEILPKIREIAGSKDIINIKNDKQGYPATVHYRSGSVAYLMSAEQDDVAFESKKFHHAWFDEPSRRSIYIGISRGMLTTGGHLWYTCTLLEEPWIYMELYLIGINGKNPDVAVFEGSSDQNPYISEKGKKDFLSKLTQDEYEVRWLGKPKHLKGRVFKEYDPEVHLIDSGDIPTHWPVWVGIDPHTAKPNAATFIAVSPRGIYYVCNEIYEDCTIDEFADFILDIGSQYNIHRRMIDTSSEEEGWSKETARGLLSDKGVRTDKAQKKNKKKSGIILINLLLKSKRLFIMKHCKRMAQELSVQRYKKNKRDEQIVMEEIEKKFDDMTDAMRYVLIEKPAYSGLAKPKKSDNVSMRSRIRNGTSRNLRLRRTSETVGRKY